MFFLFLFNRFRNKSIAFKIFKMSTLLIVVWTYALVSGAAPAVLRAAIMFSLLLIGRIWFRSVSVYNILAFSALLLLMFKPYLLFQLSFQFSYLALISIIYFQPHIESWFQTRNRLSTKLWRLTTVSIAAQILIFPISVFNFHQFPIYFILSGVATVFLATFVLFFGLLFLVLSANPLIGDVVIFIYTKLLEGFIQIIHAIQSLPHHMMDGIYLSQSSVILLYVAIGAVMILIGKAPPQGKMIFKPVVYPEINWAKRILTISVSCILINNLFFQYRTNKNLDLVVYDVYKKSLIDIFCGQKVYSMQSSNLEAKNIDYTSSGYRCYNGVSGVHDISTESIFTSKHLTINHLGSMVFKGKHLVFAHHLMDREVYPCFSDIVLVVNHAHNDPQAFLDNHNTALVVLDNSINYKMKKRWKEECRKHKIKYFDVQENGVFRM